MIHPFIKILSAFSVMIFILTGMITNTWPLVVFGICGALCFLRFVKE